jgi:hypothetical protein
MWAAFLPGHGILTIQPVVHQYFCTSKPDMFSAAGIYNVTPTVTNSKIV